MGGQTSCCAEEPSESTEAITAVAAPVFEDNEPEEQTPPPAEEAKAEAATATTPEPPKPKDDSPKLTVCFRRQDGQSFDVEFTKRPCGIDFTKTTPMKVKRVHAQSVAEELGVEGGMAILTIQGEDLPNDPQSAMEVVKKFVAQLPQR
eukprot:TRINITY_DN58898_c0_g1_i1.p1 TRINITY_DN58898_c0_g1~~TRINITY_DN58898_c0_g1_i1.p1  ORF type:complete len:148 (+),score=39.70 TRINITY_DN58898_c0_g1_i1:255-698(+)